MLKEISISKVLETAMSLVEIAQTNIRMTMQAAEEIGNPLPQEYFALLQRKMNEEITVTRIGFGSEEEFSKIRDNVDFQNPRYTFFRTDSLEYRRMLLVDEKKLMFVKNEEDGRHVFYTEDPNYIKEYLDYFESHQIDK